MAIKSLFRSLECPINILGILRMSTILDLEVLTMSPFLPFGEQLGAVPTEIRE